MPKLWAMEHLQGDSGAESGTLAARSAALTINAHKNAMNGGTTPVFLRDISAQDEPRLDMHDEELNRVLGGGLVPGSIVLLGGEPGIGKRSHSRQF